MSLMLSTCITLLFAGLVSARCNCTSGSTSPDSKGSSIVLATFTDYTTSECEAACCEYPNNLCGGYSRKTSLLVGKMRGECILFGKLNLTPLTPASGYTFLFITTGSPTFEVSNVMFERTISTTSLSFPTTGINPAACQVACRFNELCQGYGMNIAVYARSEAGLCTLYSSLASTDIEYDATRVIVDCSGCARQPLTPEPLACSSGDPSRDNYALGQPAYGCFGSACFLASEATDNDLSTYVNPLGAQLDLVYVDLGQTRLVGVVTVFATNSSVNLNNLIGNQGFTIRVGDSSVCTTSTTRTEECPVCGIQKTLIASGTYSFDCRGMRGRYVVVHSLGFLMFAEMVVLPAPYFPQTDEYPAYSASGCCHEGSAIELTVPFVANTETFEAPNDDVKQPWVQVDLGPVAVPVGEVVVSFIPVDDYARCMFYGLETTRTDDVYRGFMIGVSNSKCQTDSSPCGSAICGEVSRYSFAPPNGLPSSYRVDCQGRTGRYVFVQFVAGRTGLAVPNLLVVSSLQVFPPSRIAPAIYPARASLPGSANNILASTFSEPQVAYVWQQVEQVERKAVGIVKVITTCMAHLLHQAYRLSTLDFQVPTPGLCTSGDAASFVVENAFDTYYGSDNGAVVGVSDSPCVSGGDYKSSCGGTVCGIINQALTTGNAGELHVDCRGIVGKYVYIMLPQPQTAYLNTLLLLEEPPLPLLPTRDVHTITLIPYAMEQTPFIAAVLPKGGLIDATPPGSVSVCAESCYQDSLCKSWFLNSTSCYRYLDYIPIRDDNGPSSPPSPAEQVCRFRQVNDPLQNVTDYLDASWSTFPPENFELPTEAPSAAPTAPTPSQAPSTAPTQIPSFAPSLAPTQAPSLAPSLAPTQVPSSAPSLAPTQVPSSAPSEAPTQAPSSAPSLAPSTAPSLAPTQVPSSAPSLAPTQAPSSAPSLAPSSAPSLAPSFAPTRFPTEAPTTQAPNLSPVTSAPTRRPTRSPTLHPSLKPTRGPTLRPTRRPSLGPTTRPTRHPTLQPTTRQPTFKPSRKPTHEPTVRPTRRPSLQPSARPTRIPTDQPTKRPSRSPTLRPSRKPTNFPTTKPTKIPTSMPTRRPTREPTDAPSRKPTNAPTVRPTSLTQQQLCAASATCYDCMQAKCQWIQDDPFTIGCVPFCSEFGGKCLTLLSQCPESRDTEGYCSNGFCGTMRDGCSCQLGCEPNCCADFDFSCPGGLDAIGDP